MISVLITHFNRPKELKVCLEAFQDLNIDNVRYVVSDDGSDIPIQDNFKNLKIDGIEPHSSSISFTKTSVTLCSLC